MQKDIKKEDNSRTLASYFQEYKAKPHTDTYQNLITTLIQQGIISSRDLEFPTEYEYILNSYNKSLRNFKDYPNSFYLYFEAFEEIKSISPTLWNLTLSQVAQFSGILSLIISGKISLDIALQLSEQQLKFLFYFQQAILKEYCTVLECMIWFPYSVGVNKNLSYFLEYISYGKIRKLSPYLVEKLCIYPSLIGYLKEYFIEDKTEVLTLQIIKNLCKLSWLPTIIKEAPQALKLIAELKPETVDSLHLLRIPICSGQLSIKKAIALKLEPSTEEKIKNLNYFFLHKLIIFEEGLALTDEQAGKLSQLCPFIPHALTIEQALQHSDLTEEQKDIINANEFMIREGRINLKDSITIGKQLLTPESRLAARELISLLSLISNDQFISLCLLPTEQKQTLLIMKELILRGLLNIEQVEKLAPRDIYILHSLVPQISSLYSKALFFQLSPKLMPALCQIIFEYLGFEFPKETSICGLSQNFLNFFFPKSMTSEPVSSTHPLRL